MGEVRKNLSRNIRDVIIASGVSRKVIAQKLNVSQVSVSNWITGKNSPDLETLINFCEMFDVSLNDIYSENPIVIRKDDLEKDRLLECYERLSLTGRMKLVDLADDLVRSGKYTRWEPEE